MVKLKRRHSVDCLEGPKRQDGSRDAAKGLLAKKLSPEKRNTYRYCTCNISMGGKHNGVNFARESLHTGDWDLAVLRMNEKINPQPKAASPEPEREKPPAKPEEDPAKNPLIEDAVKRWQQDNRLTGLAESTRNSNQLRMNELMALGKKHKVKRTREISDLFIATLREKWMDRGIASSTHHNYLTTLKGFFSYAIDKGWVDKSPLPRSKRWPSPKPIKKTLPIDPEGGQTNLEKILKGCLVPVIRHNNGRKPPRLRGERLALMVMLMDASALSISDAIKFDPTALQIGPVSSRYTYIRTKAKYNRKVDTVTFMPTDLALKLKSMKPLHKAYPFWEGGRRESACEAARKELARVGYMVGLTGVRPHRFRDSFAIRNLINNVPLPVVSRWMGHASTKHTEGSYLPVVEALLKHTQNEYDKVIEREKGSNVVPISA